MRGAAALTITIIAGFLILDVAIDCFHQITRARHTRTQRRHADAIRRELQARHQPPTWRRDRR